MVQLWKRYASACPFAKKTHVLPSKYLLAKVDPWPLLTCSPQGAAPGSTKGQSKTVTAQRVHNEYGPTNAPEALALLAKASFSSGAMTRFAEQLRLEPADSGERERRPTTNGESPREKATIRESHRSFPCRRD